MKHGGTKPIETARLRLRRFRAEDAAAIFENWATDPEVTRFLRWEPHRDVRETETVLNQWVEGYQKEDTYHWAIERREDGVLMGANGVFYATEPEDPKGWAPAYCIGRAFWNRGYVSEALAAVLEYFTEVTGEQTLYCCHAMDNGASGRVLEHNGFVYTHEGAYHRFDGSAVPARYYVYHKD